MVGQHDASAADADDFGRGRDMSDKHRGGRAGKALDGVMLSKPEAGVAKAFNVAGQVHGARNRAARGFAGAHADEVEDGYRETVVHHQLDEHHRNPMLWEIAWVTAEEFVSLMCVELTGQWGTQQADQNLRSLLGSLNRIRQCRMLASFHRRMFQRMNSKAM